MRNKAAGISKLVSNHHFQKRKNIQMSVCRLVI